MFSELRALELGFRVLSIVTEEPDLDWGSSDQALGDE